MKDRLASLLIVSSVVGAIALYSVRPSSAGAQGEQGKPADEQKLDRILDRLGAIEKRLDRINTRLSIVTLRPDWFPRDQLKALAEKRTIKAKDEVLVERQEIWWPATVQKVDGDRYDVHYVGGEAQDDETVSKDRIRALHELKSLKLNEEILVDAGGCWMPGRIKDIKGDAVRVTLARQLQPRLKPPD